MSRPRLVLRAALLLLVSGFMAWRAHQTGLASAAPGLDAADALLLWRIGILEWILAALALLTGGAALLALRRRRPGGALRLDGPRPPGGAAPPQGP